MKIRFAPNTLHRFATNRPLRIRKRYGRKRRRQGRDNPYMPFGKSCTLCTDFDRRKNRIVDYAYHQSPRFIASFFSESLNCRNSTRQEL